MIIRGDYDTEKTCLLCSTRSQRTGATTTPATGGDDGGDDDNEDLYTVTPKTQRTTQRTGKSSTARTAAGSSSQLSAASSHPAFQLLPQTQTVSQDSQGISPARLQLFQTALGQLIDGPLFANDAVDAEPLVAAVNARIGSGAGREPFKEEVEKALEALSERNKIMHSWGIV